MDINNRQALKAEASALLRRAREPKKLTFAYCLAALALSLVLTLGSYLLGLKISQSGGLGNMGTRAILESIQAFLPYAEFLLSMALDLGFLSAILRFSRLQYADHTDLLTGGRLFFPILRLTLLQLGLYVLLGFAASIVATQVFMFTPWAASMMETMSSISTSSLSGAALALDEATIAALYKSMVPMLVIMLLLYIPAIVFFSYRYRMARFVLLDDPNHGALAALRGSWRMTKGNTLALFKLDLSYWWYYGLLLVCAVLGYGEVVLPLLGIALPLSETAAFFLFYAVMLLGQLGVYYAFRVPMETSYAVFYNAIRPKPQEENVLGNIFQV